MAIRRIMKPTPQMIQQYLNGEMVLAYQHVNWWLYQKGSDEIIRDNTDLNNPLYRFLCNNQDKIIKSMAVMFEILEKEIQQPPAWEWLFND